MSQAIETMHSQQEVASYDVLGLGEMSSYVYVCHRGKTPEQTAKKVSVVYEQLFNTHLSEAERVSMLERIELKTEFTRTRLRVPDIACRLLHDPQGLRGVRTIAFAKKDRYQDRSITGYAPMDLEDFPNQLHQLVLGFRHLSLLLGLETELYNRANCYVALARGVVGEYNNFPVTVEMVFSKNNQIAFRL